MAEHRLERGFPAGLQRLKKVEKYVTLFLLFILLTAATAGVTTVLTGPDWTSLWGGLLLGMLLGWLLAIFRWPAWRSTLLLVIVGLLFCLLFAGGLDEGVWEIFKQFFRLVGSLPSWINTRQVDVVPLGSAIQQLFTSLAVVSGRVVVWVSGLAAGKPAFDPVAAGIVWSLVVWLVSAWAGWVVEAGQNALLAILPIVGVNLTSLSYSRSISPTIYLLLGLALVLVAVVQYDRRQQEWELTRIAFPQHKVRQIGNTAFLIAIGLVFLAALISSISLRQFTRFGQPASQPESGLAKSLGIQQPTAVSNSFSTVQSPGLPRELLIGAPPQLLAEKVMSVDVTYPSSMPQGTRLPPLYWRSYTYDVYTGHGWSTSPTQLSQYTAGEAIQSSQMPYHQLVQEGISPVPGQTGTVYAAGEPVSVDVASNLARRTSNDLFGIQTGDTGYTVQSLVPTVGESTLRAAGQDYPAWVAQRYLALPAELPGRVKQLAIQLTATEPTPYDRAHAIEQYLRLTFPYTLQVPYPPADRDLVEYFLFDLRKGYCDYYASAMVVLARAAGVPARLAVGYASGTYKENTGLFVVAQADAHSWVEVYFPGIGWVPFEPTAGSPAIDRTGQVALPATPTVTPVAAPTKPGPAGTSRINALYLIVGFLALAGFAWALYDETALAQLPPEKAPAEIYRRLRQYGRHLAVSDDPGQTPYEYGTFLLDWMDSFDRQRSGAYERFNREIPALLQRIVLLSYRPSETGDTIKTAMLHQWRSVRWQLRWLWFRRLLRSVRQFMQPGRLSSTGKTPA